MTDGDGSSPDSRRDGGKALLLTVLGELVLPDGGAAWTATLVDALGALGVGERNARQAIARIGDDGIIAVVRHGRLARWHLTDRGVALLTTGAQRIYEFGATSPRWRGEWLVVHCSVPESQRATRHQLQRRLTFEGFGFVAPGIAVSPHVERAAAVDALLDELGLAGEAIVLRATTAGRTADGDFVTRAWDVAALASEYGAFIAEFGDVEPDDERAAFVTTVRLVHAWRRFPFIDPELPAPLLPADWPGVRARSTFVAQRAAWARRARAWFAQRESATSIV